MADVSINSADHDRRKSVWDNFSLRKASKGPMFRQKKNLHPRERIMITRQFLREVFVEAIEKFIKEEELEERRKKDKKWVNMGGSIFK